MDRFSEVDTGEVTFGEHHLLGAQPREVFFSKVMIGELAV